MVYSFAFVILQFVYYFVWYVIILKLVPIFSRNKNTSYAVFLKKVFNRKQTAKKPSLLSSLN